MDRQNFEKGFRNEKGMALDHCGMADAATVHPDRLVLLGSASRYDELFHKAVEAVRNGGDLLAPRYVFEMSRMLAPAGQTEKPG